MKFEKVLEYFGEDASYSSHEFFATLSAFVQVRSYIMCTACAIQTLLYIFYLTINYSDRLIDRHHCIIQ